MSKFLVILFLIPLMLQGITLSVEVNLEKPAGMISPEGLSKLGYGTQEAPGTWQLPVKTVNILLPANARITSWNCVLAAPQSAIGKAPARNQGFFDGEQTLSANSEKETYTQYSFLGLKKWGELRYASFSLLPARWDGQTWQWSNSCNLQIDYNQTKSDKGRIPPVFNEQNFFYNQSSLNKWYTAAKDRETEVMVIGTSAMFNALTPWVSFRQSQGITVSFTDIATALATGTGSDDAARLRNYLQTQYNQSPFAYLLLLGDYDSVPVAYTTPEPDGVDTVPTDFFYSDLSSNWDSDNDGRLGEYSTGSQDQDFEVDFTPEVFVGRLSTNNATQIATIANRIVAYEQSNAAWKDKNLLPAAILNYYSEPEPNMPATDGGIYMEFLCHTALCGMPNFTMYEQEGVVPSFPGDLPLNYTNLKSKLNSESWGFVNWSAHGSSASSSRKIWAQDSNGNNLPDSNEMDWQNLVTRQSFDNLNNTDGTVIFAASCYNGQIDADNTCLGEYALIKKAVGVFAATRTGWYKLGWQNPGWGGLSSYNYHVVENFRQSKTSLGAAQAYANLLHSQYYLFGDPIDSGGVIWPEQQNIYTYLLYGDPLVGYNPQPIVPQGEILVWEPVDYDGLSVVNALRSLTGMNVIYTDKLIPEYNYLDQFEAVFCLFGFGNTAYILDPASYQYSYLNSYLNNGGKLYLEGDVAWNPDDEFWGKLGTSAPLDYLTNLVAIKHLETGCVWNYALADAYAQILFPTQTTALPLFINGNGESTEPNIGIWNTNGNYRTVAASFSLCQIADGTHTLEELVGIVLDTLGVITYAPPVNNDDQSSVPAAISLSNYPNPARNNASLRIAANKVENVSLDIYNLKGQKVRSLLCDRIDKGEQNLNWDLKDDQGHRCPSGIYFYRLKTAERIITRKQVVLN